VDDALLGDLGAREHRDRLLLVHHQNAVAETEQLDGVRRDQQDRGPGGRQLAHELVDLLLGADVDAPRRLGQQVDLGGQWEPFCNGHLLLVAAAQAQYGLAGRLQADAQFLDQLVDEPAFPLAVDEPEPVEPIETGQRQVLADRKLNDEPFSLPVLRDVRDPLLHRAARSPHVQWPILTFDRALHGKQPEESRQQFPLALSLQPTQPQDFAPVQIEAHVMESLARRQVAHGEDDRLGEDIGDIRFGGEDVVHLPSHHQLHQVVRRCPGGRHGGDVFPVLEDRDAVGDGEDFIQPVRDEHRCRARLAQPAQGREEQRHLAAVQCRRGLVQNEQCRTAHQRLGDLHKLLVGEG
jgi:hypothetical protein